MIVRPDFDNMIILNTYRAGEFLNRDTTFRLHQDTATTLGVDLVLASILILHFFVLPFLFFHINILSWYCYCTCNEKAIIQYFAHIVILVEEFLFGNFKFWVGGLQLLDYLFQVALILLHLRLNLCKTSVQARFETFFERSRISASFLFRTS